MSETCNTTANCLGIQCVTSPPPSLYASMTLLPCSDPIAMRMIITYGGRLIFDRNITQSTTESATIPILNLNFPVFLDITYQPGNGSVTLGIQANILGSMYPILPQTVVPIDDNLCTDNGGTNVPPTRGTPTLPTPPPRMPTPNTTCDAANLIATEVPNRLVVPNLVVDEGCTPFENCSGVLCSGRFGTDRYNATLMILPCENPPAVHLVLNDDEGVLHVNQRIDRNTTIPFTVYGFNINLYVTLTHPSRDSLLLGITAEVPVFRTTLPIIPSTLIPLDLSTCDTYACSQWMAISDGLDALVQRHGIANLNSDSCTQYANCSGVACSVQYQTTTYNGRLESLPCMDPPGVHLKVTDQSGSVLLDRVFTKSETLQLPVLGILSIPLMVTLRQVPEGVYFSMEIQFLATRITIIPQTLIPMDRTSCTTDSPPSAPNSQSNEQPNSPAAHTVPAGLIAGVVVGVCFLLIIAATVIVGTVFVCVYLSRRRQASLSGPSINFATKDYTDESNLEEIDDFTDSDPISL